MRKRDERESTLVERRGQKVQGVWEEIESITHVLKEYEETRGEISEEEFLKGNGKG